MSNMARFALAAFLASCAPSLDHSDPLCGERCDDLTSSEIVWQYAAGQHEWASCANEAGTVTCSIAVVDHAIQADRVRVGNVGGFGSFGSVDLDSPDFRYGSSDDITLYADPPGSWTGELQRDFFRPTAGDTVRFFLPYDVWRVTLTKLDDAPTSLIMSHNVEVDGRDGQGFMLTAGPDGPGLSAAYLGSLSLPKGEETPEPRLPCSSDLRRTHRPLSKCKQRLFEPPYLHHRQAGMLPGERRHPTDL